MGFVVAKECLNVPSRYTIAGLHRFESDLIKTSEMSETSDEPIREAIKAFRKRYLMGVDAVIVIGGKQNTLAEIEVAKKENKSIFYLPCMGGIGTQCYDKAYSMGLIDKDYPCYSCDECISCRKIGKLCDYIANKLYELS